MAKKKMKGNGFVVVQKDWFDLTVHPLVTGTPSKSQINSHILIGPIDDDTDPRGLWMLDVDSHFKNRADGKNVTMRLMIPWQFVMAFGVSDEPVKIPAGFTATVLSK